MAHGWASLRSLRHGFACGLALWICSLHAGCGNPVAPPEPDAKVHLKKVLELYKLYVERNRQGPPSAEALKEFGKKLTPQERDERMIGEDLEASSRRPATNSHM